jgi:diguanylate cyclase (GGDEF)-like protein
LIETHATGVVAGPPTLAHRGESLRAALLPALTMLGRRGRSIVTVCFIALVTMIVADVLHVVFGVGGSSWESAMRGYVVAAAGLACLISVGMRAYAEREHRVIWTVAAIGVGFYAVAFVLWGVWFEHLQHPPNPSLADVFWKGFYAFAIGAIILAGGRSAQRGASVKIWLDTLIAVTGTAAIATAFIIPPIEHAARGTHAAIANDLQYPVGDMIILVLSVAVVGMRGWRTDRKWGLLIASMALLLAGDLAWGLQVAHGANTGNSADMLTYLLAFTCAAAAVWQPERDPTEVDSQRWSTVILPIAFTVVAPTILVFDHFSKVSLAAFLLTMTSLVAAIVRMTLTMRDMLAFGHIRRAAMTDDLTGLPNRRMFFTHLREQIAVVERDGRTLTAMMLDLDNFKQLNDTLGHDAGDELLRMIGPRLERAARTEDLIARLGGDEFAILLDTGSEDLAGTRLAQAVVDSFSEPFHVHGLVLRLTASVGIASFPRDADGAETLLKCADVAMYDAKRSRRGFEHYSSERDMYTRERLELSGELAAALEGEAIEAFFQPIVVSDSRLIVGAEALVRWRRPDGSLRPPSEFLEAAEMAGLSRTLTRRMMGLALTQARMWRDAGHPIYVSLNAAVADLLDESFPDEIATALQAHGLASEALTIEVTESSIVANPERIGAVIKRIRALGVEVALDDFGTGYSSLTHLRQLPVDAVKIDRSFVTEMCNERADAAIVYATIELAHRLDLRVVAEGVEDESTWQLLIELGSDRIQGYAMSRPLEPHLFRALLETVGSTHFADSQSVPTPASTASGGSIV